MGNIYFSVSNDLSSDQRVHRIISSLTAAGACAFLIGRKLPGSLPLGSRNYITYRLKLLFKKGFLFYAFFNIRLFCFLLFKKKIDGLVANDLDTLPANYLVSRIRKIPLVYDSHEYFTEVPELQNRRMVRAIWLFIEKRILPHIQFTYTVSQPIADAYNKKYGVHFKLVRNFPSAKIQNLPYTLPFKKDDKKILLYQGAVNMGRGLELIIDAVAGLENIHFIIAGDGDIIDKLRIKVIESRLESRIHIIGKLPLEQLASLTCQVDGGVSLEEDMGLNYRYALPNKLFDYIQAGIPVLVSSLPEMQKILNEYNVGLIADSRTVDDIRSQIKILLFDEEKRKIWKEELGKAAKVYTWEKEEKELLGIYSAAGLII